jgi:hypothetical protein
MARLTYRQKRALPSSKLCDPTRSVFPNGLPCGDASHVRVAASRLSQAINAGRVGPARAEMIHRRIASKGRQYGVSVSPLHAGRHAARRAANPLKSSTYIVAGIGALAIGATAYWLWSLYGPGQQQTQGAVASNSSVGGTFSSALPPATTSTLPASGATPDSP